MKHIFKKGIAILLATLCALNLTVVSFAKETVTSGTCGENVTWSFDEGTGTLTISGEGAMYDFDGPLNMPWNEHLASIKMLIIGNGVTSIGSFAFNSCEKLISVEIPESITKINDHAFAYCDSLASVSIPNSVTSIGDYAFISCDKLVNVTIGNSVISIGTFAFDYCLSLKTIEIPDSVTSIGDYAFSSCPNLISVDVSDGVTRISSHMFSFCTKLENIVIPDSVTTIGDYAFYECDSLTSVTIPDSTTIVEAWAFNQCDSLTSVTIGGSVAKIGDCAFARCPNLTTTYYPGTEEQWNAITIGADNEDLTKNIVFDYKETMTGTCGENATWSFDEINGKLTISGTGAISDNYMGWESFKSDIKNIEISNGITKIGVYAFESCTSLISVELTDSLVCISEGAFYNCTNLRSIEIPDGITKIEAYTFSGCTSLEKVIIPDSVVNVDENAFKETVSLLDVYYKGDVADWCEISFNESIFSTGVNLYINDALIENLVIPNGITTIGDYVFSFCTSLKSVEMPKSLTRIGEGAFYNCTNLQSIEIPESVTSIGDSAFVYTKTGTDVYYTGGIEDWCAIEFGFDVFVTGMNLYINRVLIENLVIPEGVVEISDYAFQYCISIKNIEFPKSIKTIGSGAFCHCKALTSVTVPEGVTILKPYTFLACDNLSDVTLPKSLLSIEFAVFSYCTELESIIIPDNVEILGSCAFNATSLTSIVIPESMKEIGGVSFFGKDEFTTYYKGTEDQWNKIKISTANNFDLFKNIIFNYVATSGACGENATWAFDKTNGTLTISGTGTVSDYSGWSDIASGVTYVEIGSGITSVGEKAFIGFGELKEVYLAESVSELGADAFKDCSKLAIVTALANDLSFENAFSGNDSRLFFVAKADSRTYNALESAGYAVNGISTDREKDGHKVLAFDGKTTIYQNLDYNYISNLIADNSDTYYLYFNKITFEGISPDIIIIDEENLDSAEEYFTLNEVYISVSVNGKTVSLPELVQLLQDEDADGIISFEEEEGETFFEMLSDFFEETVGEFVTQAFKVIKTVINAIRKLFK